MTKTQRKICPTSTLRPGYEKKVYSYSNSMRARHRKGENGSSYSNAPKNTSNFFLSPLYPSEFTYSNTKYKSVIHYLESQKHNKCKGYHDLILDAETPMEALLLGKCKFIHNANNDPVIERINEAIIDHEGTHNCCRRDADWKKTRNTHFVHATYMKFKQNPELKEALMATYPYPILEDTLDPYWGTGRRNRDGKHTGLNMGGRHLSHVRKISIGNAMRDTASVLSSGVIGINKKDI